MGYSYVNESKMSRVMRKTFCICENKGARQLHSNCKADQRLCFCYTDSTITLLINPKFPVCVGHVQKPHCWFSHDAAKMSYKRKYPLQKEQP